MKLILQEFLSSAGIVTVYTSSDVRPVEKIPVRVVATTDSRKRLIQPAVSMEIIALQTSL